MNDSINLNSKSVPPTEVPKLPSEITDGLAPIFGLLGITDFVEQSVTRIRPTLKVGDRVVVDNPQYDRIAAGAEATVTEIVADYGAFTAIFLDIDGFGKYSGMDIEVSPR